MGPKVKPPIEVKERRMEPFDKGAWKDAICTAPLFGPGDPMMIVPTQPTPEQAASDEQFRSQYVDGGVVAKYQPGMAEPVRYAEGKPQIFNIQIAFVKPEIKGETSQGDPACSVKTFGPLNFKASNVQTGAYKYEIRIPELYSSSSKMVFYVDQATYDLIAGMQKKGEPVVFGAPKAVGK